MDSSEGLQIGVGVSAQQESEPGTHIIRSKKQSLLAFRVYRFSGRRA